jgi:hypothetical protein
MPILMSPMTPPLAWTLTTPSWPSIALTVVTLLVLSTVRLGWLIRLLFGPIQAVRRTDSELPADVREYFGSQDPLLQSLGFQPAGDYQMVHGRNPSFSRFYLSEDQEVYAEVELYRRSWLTLRGTADFKGVSLVTVFSDGTSVHTSAIALPATTPGTPGMVFIGRPDLSLEARLTLHRAEVAAHAARHATEVLRYPPEQLAEVSAYKTQWQRDYWSAKPIISLLLPRYGAFAR